MTRLLPLLIAGFAIPAFAQDAPPPASPTGGAMSAGKDETRADVEARSTMVFQKLDANGDGVVTVDELKAMVAKRMGTTPDKVTTLPPMLKAMLEDADLNHDGKVTLDEAKASALKGFDEADTNHDGVVTAAERMALSQKVTNEVAPKSAVGR